MILRPESVSSIVERRSAIKSCPFLDLLFKDFPIRPIIVPAIGNSINTKRVNCGLIFIITIKETVMIIGFLMNISNEFIMEFSTS